MPTPMCEMCKKAPQFLSKEIKGKTLRVCRDCALRPAELG